MPCTVAFPTIHQLSPGYGCGRGSHGTVVGRSPDVISQLPCTWICSAVQPRRYSHVTPRKLPIWVDPIRMSVMLVRPDDKQNTARSVFVDPMRSDRMSVARSGTMRIVPNSCGMQPQMLMVLRTETSRSEEHTSELQSP